MPQVKNELDYMEYANDGAAQAAYVKSGFGEEVNQQQTAYDDQDLLGDGGGVEYRKGQSFQLYEVKTITAVEVMQNSTFNSPSGNWTLRIETDSG